MYTTYEFYLNNFHGEIIPINEFDKYADHAGDDVDVFTFDRLVGGLPSDERTAAKVQKAVCALAELLYKIDQEEKKAEESAGYVKQEDGTVIGKQVTSISSGTEKISYSTGQDSSVSLSGIYRNSKSRENYKRALVSRYLNGVADDKGVPLLYAGL